MRVSFSFICDSIDQLVSQQLSELKEGKVGSLTLHTAMWTATGCVLSLSAGSETESLEEK